MEKTHAEVIETQRKHRKKWGSPDLPGDPFDFSSEGEEFEWHPEVLCGVITSDWFYTKLISCPSWHQGYQRFDQVRRRTWLVFPLPSLLGS